MTPAEKFEILKTENEQTNILSDKKISRDEIIKTGANVDAWKGSKDYEELRNQHDAELQLFQTQLDLAQGNENAQQILIDARKANLQVEAKKASVQTDMGIINTLTENTTDTSIEGTLIQSLIAIGKISTENLKKIAETLQVPATSLAGVIDTCKDCGTMFDMETIKAVGKLQFFAFDQYIKEVQAMYQSGVKYKIDRSAGPATFRTIKTILQENQSIIDTKNPPADKEEKTNQPGGNEFPSKNKNEINENFTGKATVIYPVGGTVAAGTYQGEFVNGAWEGQGRFTLPDGTYKEGKRSADGSFDGTKYDKSGKVIATYQAGKEVKVTENPNTAQGKNVEENHTITAQKLYEDLNSGKTVDLTKIDKEVLEGTEKLFVDELLRSGVKLDDQTSEIERSKPVTKLRELAQKIVKELDRRIQENDKNITKKPDQDPNANQDKPEINNDLITESLTKLGIDADGIAQIKETATGLYPLVFPNKTEVDVAWVADLIDRAIANTDKSITGDERRKLIMGILFELAFTDKESAMNEILNQDAKIAKGGYGAAFKLDNKMSSIIHSKELAAYGNGDNDIYKYKIEMTKLGDFFDMKADPDYFNHLSANLGQVEKIDGGYAARYTIIKEGSRDDKGKEVTNGKYETTEVKLTFDEKGNLTSKEVVMPKMFGFVRTYEMKNGKFQETAKSLRERTDKVSKQEKTLTDMIKDTQSGTFIGATFDKIDVDGNYKINFKITNAKNKKTGTTVNEIPKQSFQVHFETDTNSNEEQIVLNDTQVAIKNNDKMDWNKRVKGVFNIEIQTNEAGRNVFKINVSANRESAPAEELLISSLPSGGKEYKTYYEKTGNEKNKGSDINIITAAPGEKYYNLVKIETTNNGKELKAPNELSVFPFGTSSIELGGDKYLQNFLKDKDALISGLLETNPGMTENDIYDVIQEYNKPIKERVYAIQDPVTKIVRYYTAEKDENKITFKEDSKIKTYIEKCQKELKDRFVIIENNYLKEKKIIEKVLPAKKMEKRNVDGLYTLEIGDINKQTNQKASILSEKYDGKKVQYLVTINVTEGLIVRDKEVATSDNPPYRIYFDSEGAYDTEENKKMYAKEKNKPIINDVVGTIEPSSDKDAVIKFFDQSSKNEKSF